MTTPWRRVDLAALTTSSPSSGSESEQSESSPPQRDPPQSSLTRSPLRVMPKRWQEQLEDELEVRETALAGEEQAELRLEVKDGTSESSLS